MSRIRTRDCERILENGCRLAEWNPVLPRVARGFPFIPRELQGCPLLLWTVARV